MTLRNLFIAIALLLPASAGAQGANVAFGGLSHDSSLPVEISSDQLKINQNDGSATFTGNVIIGQGDMRLTAAIVDVEYDTARSGSGEIERLHARGGVTLVSGQEAAEAREAVYTIDSGRVVMTGDVIMTQGENALASDRMVVNLDDGTGVMEGRVRVVFKSGSDQ